MIVESTMQLTDASLPEEEELRIRKIIESVPEVRGCHCLRTRRSGSYKLLDVHVLFDGTMHLSQVHAICDELEQLIRKEFGTFDIMIHPEPAATTTSRRKSVSTRSRRLMAGNKKPEGFLAISKKLCQNRHR